MMIMMIILHTYFFGWWLPSSKRNNDVINVCRKIRYEFEKLVINHNLKEIRVLPEMFTTP